jgi:hypothetical protein
MATMLMTERYEADIYGVLNCYDRVIISGHLQPLCYAKGMTKYLYSHDIRIFDYTKFTEPLRDTIRTNAQTLATANGVEIEFITKHNAFRKEDRIKQMIEQRGEQPGLVHIFSAMEPCQAYRPWHDKVSHKTYVKLSQSKCLHYYFYFIDPDLGLCYLRVPTWCPFRLQFYFNGHNALAARLKQAGLAFELADNAFLTVADFDQANQLALLDLEQLQGKLDQLAEQYCPVLNQLELHYYWSIVQAEYATDIVFKTQPTLQAFYPATSPLPYHSISTTYFLGNLLVTPPRIIVGRQNNPGW